MTKNDNLKNLIFLFLEGLYLIIIELFNQILIKSTIFIELSNMKTALIFDILYVLGFFLFVYILPPKIRKIIINLHNIIFLIITMTNYFIYSYFGNIFSWRDLFLAGDGFSFINSIFKFINVKLIIYLIISILLLILINKSINKISLKITKRKIILACFILTIIIITKVITKKIYLSNTSDGWDSEEVLNNGANYYQDWINPVRLLRICGTYEYIMRDFTISFLKKDNYKNSYNEVKDYLQEHQNKNETKNYQEIFKNKNLIFVMMEAMDDWLVNEYTTPTIYQMMHHGFNFTNHYSPGYVTGDTANTEFIANTGIYPNISKLSPNYAYVNNSYPYALPNLFKEEGYFVNSYHRSNGNIYNRENMHLSFGYTKYHNYQSLDISEDNINLDSYLIKDGYDKIVFQEKFMSFIITYSPHSPYTYQKEECQIHLEEIKKIYPEETNEEILCAYSSARETDEMFKSLLENLSKDNLLEDTIIIAFSDHPNKILLREDETKLLNKTVFFIYNNTMDSHQIDTITSSINILPTVINLFGINSKYYYPGYDALNYQDGYVIFNDYTYYDGSNIKKITQSMQSDIDYSKNLLISNYYNTN